MRCANCRTENRANAPFCIECGEPLELGNSPYFEPEPTVRVARWGEAVLASQPQPRYEQLNPWQRLNPLKWSREIKIGGLLLLALLFFDLTLQATSRSDAERYHAGTRAINEQRWHVAEAELRSLVGKNYQDADKLHQTAKQRVLAFDAAYNQAEAAADLSRPWAAVERYTAAREIEPQYPGLSERIASIYSGYGRTLYLRTDSAYGGIYSSQLDGSDLTKFQGSGDVNVVHALSPDGRRVLFSGGSYYPNFFLGILGQTRSTRLSGFYYDDDSRAAAGLDGTFVDDGKAVLTVIGAPLGVASTLSISVSFSYLKLDNYDQHQREQLQLVARPDPADKQVIYVTLDAGSNQAERVRVYNSDDDSDRELFAVSGHVLSMQVLGRAPGFFGGDPQRLLYVVREGENYSVRLRKLGGEQQETTLASYQLPPVEVPDIRSMRYPNQQPLTEPHPDPEVALSRDGKWAVAYVASEAALSPYLIDMAKGEATAWQAGSVRRISFSPDAEKLLVEVEQPTAYGNSQRAVEIRDRAGKLLTSRKQPQMMQAGWLNDRYFYFTTYANLSGSTITYNSYLADSSDVQADRFVATYESRTLAGPALRLTADGKGLIYLNTDGVYISTPGGDSPLRIGDPAEAVWLGKS